MDRVPIQTYVMEYDEETVREAINRELRRDGQVYYVYNRVNDIADVRARLSKLIPDAKVDFCTWTDGERTGRPSCIHLSMGRSMCWFLQRS